MVVKYQDTVGFEEFISNLWYHLNGFEPNSLLANWLPVQIT